MGIDATGYTLGLLAIGLTMVAVRTRNLLISIGTSGLWAALMAFFLANTAAAASFHTIFIVSTMAFIIAMLFLGVGRGMLAKDREEQAASSKSVIKNVIKQFKGEYYEPPSRGETTLEYREKVRKAARGNKTRRR